MNAIVAKVEDGAIHLEESGDWAEGQVVLVIALPTDDAMCVDAPPVELLEEDTREFAPRPELLTAVNKRELA